MLDLTVLQSGMGAHQQICTGFPWIVLLRENYSVGF